MWALIGITVIALLSVAAMHLARGEQSVNDNFDSGRRALYLADQALSQFYATFRPSTSLSIPVISTVEDDSALAEGDSSADDGGTTTVEGDFTGADLKVSNITFENGNAVVTPTKIVESQFGDVYLLEADAAIFDARGDRPAALRSLRTYASLQPPFKLRGALTAPGGVIATAVGDHFHVDGGKKGKCGSGTGVPALATPTNSTSLHSQKVHIKADQSGVGIDSTTTSYQELVDSLHIDFPSMIQDAYYAGVTNFVDVPRDYPTVDAVFAANNFASNALWPVILVHGNATITTKTKGFGMLVVEGSLTLATVNLDWKGIILTGKNLNVTGKAHLHEMGAVAAGLNCTAAQNLANLCDVNFSGGHLGVAYAQCESEAAWAQLLILRPLTPSRHTRLY